jgi:hypothetical protein
MERATEFETEAEVLPNRLRLRKYLRELVLNQKKVYEMIEKKRQINIIKTSEIAAESEAVAE